MDSVVQTLSFLDSNSNSSSNSIGSSNSNSLRRLGLLRFRLSLSFEMCSSLSDVWWTSFE